MRIRTKFLTGLFPKHIVMLRALLRRRGGDSEMAQTMTTAQVADEVGTDPKRLRRFLRSNSSPVAPAGQGHRYSIERKDLKAIKAKFQEWATPRTPATK